MLRIIAENGIRVAARKLDEMFHDRVLRVGKSFKDLVVYVVYGNDGYMTPNLYWAPPGMVAPPMYVLGRYWTNYTPTFMGPEDFAKSSLSRAIAEALIDDAGLCRFHRGGWAEPVLDKLYLEVTGMPPNKDIYREIVEYSMKANAEPKHGKVRGLGTWSQQWLGKLVLRSGGLRITRTTLIGGGGLRKRLTRALD